MRYRQPKQRGPLKSGVDSGTINCVRGYVVFHSYPLGARCMNGMEGKLLRACRGVVIMIPSTRVGVKYT